MKHLKKFMSILLTAIMVLAMCVPVMAETVNNTTGNDYKAYQIFAGEQTDNTSATLTDIIWGNGVDSSAIVSELKNTYSSNYPDLINKTTAPEQASYIAEVLANNTSLAEQFAKVVAAHVVEANAISVTKDTKNINLAAGYYLFKDTTINPAKPGDPINDVIGLSLLQVTKDGNIEITKKVDKPSVEKKVYEDKFADTTYGQGYNDTADYNIGDDVPFKLIGTVVDMSKFASYKYVFNDTLANSLELNESTVKVVVASTKNANTESSSEVVDITNSASIIKNKHSLTVSFDNLKEVKVNGVKVVTPGKFIIVTYTAKLLSNAGIGQGDPANTNQVNLEYSNNPNQGGEGETGKTPDDKVIVFTYELDGTKINAVNKEGLQGAKFALYRMNGTKKQYAKLDNNHKVTGWEASINSIVESDVNGKFNVIGLDAGTYYLEETQAPNEFNKLTSPIEIIITANTTNGQGGNGNQAELTEIKVKVGEGTEVLVGNENIKAGKVPVTVVNKKGSTLPETGGIGTTIFYVVGVVLMLGAGVLLITKRRMSAKH